MSSILEGDRRRGGFVDPANLDIRRAIVLSGVGATVIIVSLIVVGYTLRPPVPVTIATAIADLAMIALTARSLHLAYRIERRAHDVHEEGSLLRASLDEGTDREAQLRHLAFHDHLTGLPNRTLFKDLLASAKQRACAAGHPLVLMMIDIDSFKNLNDALGHRAGDDVLRVVAVRIKDCLRANDYAARLGGDEFAVILENVEDPNEAISVATRVRTAMETPVPVLDSSEVRVTVSTGIVVMHEPTGDPLHVLHRADLAMYETKRKNKGGFSLWTPEIATGPTVTPFTERRAMVGE